MASGSEKPMFYHCYELPASYVPVPSSSVFVFTCRAVFFSRDPSAQLEMKFSALTAEFQVFAYHLLLIQLCYKTSLTLAIIAQKTNHGVVKRRKTSFSRFRGLLSLVKPKK